jgi:phosphomevalonate kinase
LKGVAAFAAASPETYRQLLPPIADTVSRFEHALFARDAAELFAAIGAAHSGMERLGRAAGVPIVTPVLAHAAVLASEVGGAAKPSGAGGGDVGIAFLPDPEAAEQFRIRARDLGLGILDLFFDPTGIARI